MADQVKNPFGEMIKARWAALGLHQAEFCRRVNAPAGWVQQIREGKKTPPLDRMEEWVQVLELTGLQRALFLDLAAIQHIPEIGRARFIEQAFERTAKRKGAA